jgi:hypothetical protein
MDERKPQANRNGFFWRLLGIEKKDQSLENLDEPPISRTPSPFPYYPTADDLKPKKLSDKQTLRKTPEPELRRTPEKLALRRTPPPCK